VGNLEDKYILAIDIGSHKVCSLIATKNDSEKIDIIGYSSVPSEGIKKGIITNIKIASEVVKKSLDDASSMASIYPKSATVSISSAYVKSFQSSAIRNIIEKEIKTNDIKKVIDLALYNAKIPDNYTYIQIIPYSFRVDDHDDIEDPNGMSGSRLECDVFIVAVEDSTIGNIRKIIQNIGIEVKNFVLDGYASSIALLSEEDKQNGVIIVDMGGSVCSVTINRQNSLCYSSHIPVGSSNITSDLSTVLKVNMSTAEKIKLKYPTIKIPKDSYLVEGLDTNNITLKRVQEIMYARLNECLHQILASINQSSLKDKVGSDIILTGGMSKIVGIKSLAEVVFDMPVSIKRPTIKTHGELENEIFSTAIGLILYEISIFTKYEIDSNNSMKYKGFDIHNMKSFSEKVKIPKENHSINRDMMDQPRQDNTDLTTILVDTNNNKNKNFMDSFTDFFKNIF